MLEKYYIILGSQSPRRKELLQGLNIPFECKVIDTEEVYPNHLLGEEIPLFLAKKKAAAYQSMLQDNTLVITADTIVWLEGKMLGKPSSLEDAKRMLQTISGKTHEVITGVCLTTKDKQVSFAVTTEVSFATLPISEIDFYVQNYKPLDKAGSYGIQEWIGFIGVEKINGSYFNVMGLPIQRLYKELKEF